MRSSQIKHFIKSCVTSMRYERLEPANTTSKACVITASILTKFQQYNLSLKKKKKLSYLSITTWGITNEKILILFYFIFCSYLTKYVEEK